MIRGGETYLIINHDTYAATDLEAASLRHVECLLDYALTRDSRVTMNGDRQDFEAIITAATIQTSTHRAHNDRINDLQVRWVKRESQVNVATGRLKIGGETLVILNITRTIEFVAMFTGEFVKQLSRFLT